MKAPSFTPIRSRKLPSTTSWCAWNPHWAEELDPHRRRGRRWRRDPVTSCPLSRILSFTGLPIRVIHYPGQDASARARGIMDREDQFEAFRGTVSLGDIITTAEQVLSQRASLLRQGAATTAPENLTASHQQITFNYKLASESVRARSAVYQSSRLRDG